MKSHISTLGLSVALVSVIVANSFADTNTESTSVSNAKSVDSRDIITGGGDTIEVKPTI